jgi:hypothetical protein
MFLYHALPLETQLSRGHKIVKGALSAKIVNFCYPLKLSDMIDALIKRVSVTYKCYEMYAHRGKKVLIILVFQVHNQRIVLKDY